MLPIFEWNVAYFWIKCCPILNQMSPIFGPNVAQFSATAKIDLFHFIGATFVKYNCCSFGYLPTAALLFSCLEVLNRTPKWIWSEDGDARVKVDFCVHTRQLARITTRKQQENNNRSEQMADPTSTFIRFETSMRSLAQRISWTWVGVVTRSKPVVCSSNFRQAYG